tara:strand:- start:147 stop:593 length:447 start_codon:yes stop_codon:yes gene_type:complete
MISFSAKRFNSLTKLEIHDIFALRAEVFVVEQECIYQDIDGKDKEALHIIGKQRNDVVAYARILEKGISYSDHISIGRVVVKKTNRGKLIGKKLLKFCLFQLDKNQPHQEIKISAQMHLEKFYNNYGFIKLGKGYLEDGIPHIAMIRK